MAKKIFISKSIEEIQTLIDFCSKQEYELIAHSFLQFEAIPFKIENSFDAIFFGSPRAVDFFLRQEVIPPTVLVACVGEITAESLRQKGYEPDFIGKTSGNTALVAQDFKGFVGEKTVLFPQSSTSNRTISSVFEPSHVIEKSIYRTVIHSIFIPECDCYVFTSPSNVDGFLHQNAIARDASVIAWGNTTANYLESKNIPVSHILKTASIEELISIV